MIICPLMKCECKRQGCAWWSYLMAECALLAIAKKVGG